MLRPSVLAGTLAAAAIFATTSAAHADNAQALKDRLHAAEKDTSLTGDDVQPFYLKMSVQLFDPKGAPSEQGEVELYWASPSKEKLVYSFPSYKATEVHIDDKVFRTTGSGVPPARAAQLVGLILHPMAQISEIDKSEPQVQKVTMGKVQLDCIILAKPIGGAPVTVGLFPTYCLDPAADALRASIAPSGQIVLRNLISVFQQRHAAQDVVITTRGVQAAEGKIESLESAPSRTPILLPTALY